MSRNSIILILILLLAAVAIAIALPITYPASIAKIVTRSQDATGEIPVKLGLDLRGGTQVMLEPDTPTGQTPSVDELERARTIIERRVNGLGVAEALVQVAGERLIVSLPGVEDPDAAIETLRGTGQLEFVELKDTYLEPGTKIVTDLNATDVSTDTVVYHTVLTGDKLSRADVSRDPTTNQFYISFELTTEGGKIFDEYSGANIGKFLAIVMDKTILSAPVIEARIGTSGQITGNFTVEEARNLAVQMQYGALPISLDILAVRTIGPTLGADSVRSSVTAGIIGIAIVLLFMVISYRLPGLLAALALVIYASLNLAFYKVMPVVLTLPGIAGFLLSTGMAVDANILIFERMREELRGGRSLGSAVEAGFSRAWTSILDSNLSTLLTCLILYYFGSNFGASIVQGFAVTLFIGVLLSMFTAVIVTRTFMRFVVGTWGERLSRHMALFAA